MKMRSWAVLTTIMAMSVAAQASDRKTLMLNLPETLTHPSIACTPEQLARLQAAYRGDGAAQEVVAAKVRDADAAVAEELVFPPRGGQHNQWYQCVPCQMGLKTIDETHHRCPKCGTVYTGAPYDDVRYLRKHHRNTSNALAAAWAYAITGDAKYARYTRDVLVGYSQRYLQYPLHNPHMGESERALRSGGRIFSQTLDEAYVMATRIAPAYDLIYDSEVLTVDDHRAIGQDLIGPMLKQISRHKAGKSNWQSWHNAGLFAGGLLIGDHDAAARSINDPANGFIFQMTASISPEGMWYENSWGYHFYTLKALVSHAGPAGRVGVDLWSQDRFKKMFSLPRAYTMADGSLPRFGDAVQNSAGGQPSLLEAGYHASGDPTVLAMLPSKVSWESILYGRDVNQRTPAPKSTSTVVNEAGHAILRTDGKAGLTAAMTFGPYGGFHGHFDKLSFVLFGYGRELGVDPGRAASQAYRLPIHSNWYKATLSHNAVLVDTKPQAPAAGELLAFAAEPTCAVAVAGCNEAYEGVAHRRLLCLTDTYALVVDDLVAAGAERRFDWIYHDRAEVVTCEAATEGGSLGESHPGGEYVKHVRGGRTDAPVRVVFKGLTGRTYLTVAAAAGAEVRIGYGVGKSVLDRVPLAMVTHRGSSARFACTLEPTAGESPPTIQTVEMTEQAGALVVTVRREGGCDTITWGADDRVTVRRDDREILSIGR